MYPLIITVLLIFFGILYLLLPSIIHIARRFYFRMADYFAVRQFLKFYRKTFFYRGWGDKERWERIDNYLKQGISKHPPIISELSVVIDKNMKNGERCRVISFLSPCHEILSEGGKDAFFSLNEPPEEKRNNKLLVIQVAGGQKSVGWRYKKVGHVFTEQGYTVLMPYPPGGKFRISKQYSESEEAKEHMFEYSSQYVFGPLVSMHALIQETRAAVNYLTSGAFEYGLEIKDVVISGQSWGAVQSVHIANYQLSHRSDLNVGVVAVTGTPWMISRRFLRLHGTKKLDVGACPVETEEKEDYFKMMIEVLRKRFYPTKFDISATPSSVKRMILVNASDDIFYGKGEQCAFVEFARQILRKNGREVENDLYVEDWVCGHFTSFTNYQFLMKYHSLIFKMYKSLGDK